MSFEVAETPAPGEEQNYIPLSAPMKHRRFIQALHIPSQGEWYSLLAGCAFWTTHGTPEQIIDQAVIDDLVEQQKEQQKRKGKKRGRRR